MSQNSNQQMTARQFMEEPEVRRIVHDLEENYRGKEYSDIIDNEGHQYVDIVMQGGGVLGIALVGYTYVLEQAGIRFLRIGGTSAGAINAMLLAALDTMDKPKSVKIIEELANLDMYSFVDGGTHVKIFIETMVQEVNQYTFLHRHFPLAYDLEKLTFVVNNIKDHMGLNPGIKFEDWLIGVLRRVNITTTRELNQRIGTMPSSLGGRPGVTIRPESTQARLAVIAADVTTETKVEFPLMAELYWPESDEVHPAKYVRASMSIPFFFHPFKVSKIPKDSGDGGVYKKWKDLTGYEGSIPKECLFIDGGIMSNFPINLFHKSDKIPAAPTFGVQLSTIRMDPHQIGNPLNLSGAIFDAARHCMDYEFITHNPDYQKLIASIDTKHHNWLNFQMTDDEKIELFVAGARAAHSFLIEFDWKNYKRIRGHLAQACKEIKRTDQAARVQDAPS